MPKRVIDFDAMWASDKLAACPAWAQAEYAWLYGLADSNGSFELTNLRVIWGKVAAIRKDLALARLEQVFDEFHARGLLFTWEENGKRYGHWTNSDQPGRLPPPSWRVRLERLAPPVPQAALAAYTQQFARGAPREPAAARPSTSLGAGKDGLEAAQGQEVERELTGQETEPWEIIYFKLYKSQSPVVERAIETAALMLGSDKSRGYCLEMICADFLAGANLDNGNPETLLFSMTRFFNFLPREQKRSFLENVGKRAL